MIQLLYMNIGNLFKSSRLKYKRPLSPPTSPFGKIFVLLIVFALTIISFVYSEYLLGITLVLSAFLLVMLFTQEEYDSKKLPLLYIITLLILVILLGIMKYVSNS